MQTLASPPAPATAALAWACPRCRGDLAPAAGGLRCPACGDTFARREGIWRFLTGEEERAVAAFVREYETVRAAEGWGAGTAAYFRNLPVVPAADPHRAIWARRARSFAALIARVVAPAERDTPRPLTILDLGAGNGWLSHQLARRGHTVAAIDLVTNDWDGLGAHARYREGAAPAPFAPVQATFDRLPFAAGRADLVIFNAALHYARRYEATLREALRALQPAGQIVVLDSPHYRDAGSGARMVREREARFAREHGFAGDTLANEGYLTDARLAELARDLGLTWQVVGMAPAWRGRFHAARARLRGRREAAEMPLIAGRRAHEGGAARPDAAAPGMEPGAGDEGDRPETRPGGLGPAREAGERPHIAGRATGTAFRPPHSDARIRAARFLTRWRFRLFQRHRYDRLVLEEVRGTPLVVLPGVFNPQLLRTGAFLAETLSGRLIPPGGAVLDLGTGSGIGAVFAARWAGRVVASDINPAATRCARINALLNRVEDRVEAREGDLFATVAGERFDAILFNPPYYRGTPRDALDHAWRSNDTVERFAAALRDHLTPDGHALVVLSTDGETPAFLASFAANGFAIEVVAERDHVHEVITIYRLVEGRRSKVEGPADAIGDPGHTPTAT